MKNWQLLIILSLAAIFLSVNLGNQYLWMDEAETAILARSILKYGFPYAWDGTNLMMVGGNGSEFNTHFLWLLHPWLQNYIAAFSFMLFGENTWSARLLFALLAWLTVLFVYILAYRITSNRTIALLAAFLLAISIPFVLYMRQCRYYAILSSLSFPLVYSYYRIPQKRYTFLFFLFLVLLFFSHYLFMATVCLALVVHLFIFDYSPRKFRHLVSATLPVFFIALFWFFPMGLRQTVDSYLISGGRQAFSSSLIETIRKQLSFLINLNMNLFPLSLLAFAVLLPFLKKGKMHSPRLYTLLLVTILVNTVLIPFTGIHPERYTAGLIPLFCVFLAMVFYEIFTSHRLSGIIVILIFLATNIFNEIPAIFSKPIILHMPLLRDRLASVIGFEKMNPLSKDIREAFTGKRYYFDFLYEISHDYDGPIEGIVEFLNRNAEAGDVIVTPYGQNPIMFYCGYKNLRLAKIVENRDNFFMLHPELKNKLPDYIFDYSGVDWFIPRSHWEGVGYTEEEILSYVLKKGWQYERLEIPYPDIRWNNRPELRLHYFKTAAEAPRVVVYRIIKQKQAS